VGRRVVGVQADTDTGGVCSGRDETLGCVHERRSDSSALKRGQHVEVDDLRNTSGAERGIVADPADGQVAGEPAVPPPDEHGPRPDLLLIEVVSGRMLSADTVPMVADPAGSTPRSSRHDRRRSSATRPADAGRWWCMATSCALPARRRRRPHRPRSHPWPSPPRRAGSRRPGRVGHTHSCLSAALPVGKHLASPGHHSRLLIERRSTMHTPAHSPVADRGVPGRRAPQNSCWTSTVERAGRWPDGHRCARTLNGSSDPRVNQRAHRGTSGSTLIADTGAWNETWYDNPGRPWTRSVDHLLESSLLHPSWRLTGRERVARLASG
jgi:hypothetical protein